MSDEMADRIMRVCLVISLSAALYALYLLSEQ